MKISRDPRFFLKVAFAYLVVSLFLPFAFESTFMSCRYLWPADYDGPFWSPSYRVWSFYWSFLYVSETVPISLLPPSTLLPPDPMIVGIKVSFLPEIWGWRAPLLQSIFPLQMVLLVLGFFTVKRARKALSVIPFFLGMIVLTALYYFKSLQHSGTPIFGFWVLIVATLFTSIALTRAKKWI